MISSLWNKEAFLSFLHNGKCVTFKVRICALERYVSCREAAAVVLPSPSRRVVNIYCRWVAAGKLRSFCLWARAVLPSWIKHDGLNVDVRATEFGSLLSSSAVACVRASSGVWVDEHACWGPAVAVGDGRPTPAGVHHAGRRAWSIQSGRGELSQQTSEICPPCKKHDFRPPVGSFVSCFIRMPPSSSSSSSACKHKLVMWGHRFLGFIWSLMRFLPPPCRVRSRHTPWSTRYSLER